MFSPLRWCAFIKRACRQAIIFVSQHTRLPLEIRFFTSKLFYYNAKVKLFTVQDIRFTF